MVMMRKWKIRWRGKITRDIGEEYELAEFQSEAKEQFTSRYPMREIIDAWESE